MSDLSQRREIGFCLALFTAILWGALPIALKLLVSDQFNAQTLTWYRFVVAVTILGVLLWHNKALPGRVFLNRRSLGLLLIAILGLVGNYVVFLWGLREITPEASQVLIQLGPTFFLLGSVFLFKEIFRPVQWLGLLILLIGLGLFFHQHLDEIYQNRTRYALGLAYIVLAAAIWASYALAQKALMRDMSPSQILFIIYVAGVLLLLPTVSPGSVQNLNGMQWGMLAFSAINTVLAYLCFAKAQQYIESSRVSAIITLTPLFTLMFSALLAKLWVDYEHAETLDGKSITGAVLVVIGSMRAVLVGKEPQTHPGEPPAETIGTEPDPL